MPVTKEIPPPPRVVRLDLASYRHTLATLLQGRPADLESKDSGLDLGGAPFEWVNSTDRFSTLNLSYGIDSNDFALLESNARHITALYKAQFDPTRCFGSTLKDASCQQVVLSEAGALLLGRPLTKEDTDELMRLAWPEDAFGTRLRTLLMHPEFIFRSELGARGTAASVQPLTPFELANALAYSLTSHPPDSSLYTDATTGALTQDEVLTTHVDRLLASRAHRERVKQFLREFWRYREAANVAKDIKPKDVFPKDTPGAQEATYDPGALVQETDRLVDELIAQSLHQDFLATLLTTPLGYISKDTAIFYNRASTSKAMEQVGFPATERQGLMMQPSWLVAMSESDHNNPIRRGVFIQESLLCGFNPQIPIEGVPTLKISSDKTLREALGEHLKTETSCGGCHLLMDPLALPLEQFDHFGRHRTQEAGRPVETQGELRWSGGDFEESGQVRDAFDLVERLARSEKVEQCFLKHAFEFWTGREATPGDARALSQAHEAYRRSGGDFNAALRVMLMSPVFRLRTLP